MARYGQGSDYDGPTGVGGWMYLFLFSFALLLPLYLFLEIKSFINMLLYNIVWHHPKALDAVTRLPQFYDGIVSFVQLALIGYTVWRLYNRKNTRTVRYTQISIVLIGIIFQMVKGYVKWRVILPNEDAWTWYEYTGPSVYIATYWLGWVAYFQFSKRVKATYIDNREAHKAAVETFG